jgi:RimJ/RimL family protein N-acetyltransferase
MTRGPTRELAAHIRRLGRADRAQLRDHLLRLDPESRYRRFGMAASRDFIEDYAEHSFGPNDLAFGYFEDGTLRGVGELRGLGQGGAEVAVSVERDWQGRRIGAALVRRLAEAAQVRGEAKLYITCLPYNRAMQKIARELAPKMRFEAERPCAVEPRETFAGDCYSAIVDLRPERRRSLPTLGFPPCAADATQTAKSRASEPAGQLLPEPSSASSREAAQL